MMKRSVAILLIAGPLWGCGAKAHHDTLLEDAMKEREAAYARLAKAITAYCSAATESPKARQDCVLEKRLELFSIGVDGENRKSEQTVTLHTPLPDFRNHTNQSLVNCERTRSRITCQRKKPAFADYFGG